VEPAGATGDHRERISVSRTINRAKAAGWASPLAWDDDTIDDPTARSNRGTPLGGTAFDEIAVERALHGDDVHLRPVERAEVVHRLTAAGYSAAQIAPGSASTSGPCSESATSAGPARAAA
jgi:hypothetical protein